MDGWLKRGLLAVVLVMAAWLPTVSAQHVAPPLAQASGQQEEEKTEKPAPAFQYLVATLSTFLVLILICKPSRKG